MCESESVLLFVGCFFFLVGLYNLLPVKMTTLFLEFNYDIYCTYNIQTSDRLAVKIQYISFYLFTVTNKLFPFMHLFKIRHFAEKKCMSRFCIFLQ